MASPKEWKIDLTKNKTTVWPGNSHPGYMSKENENTNLKRYINLNVYSSIIYNSQNMEATQVSIDRWMDTDDVDTYTMEYHSAITHDEVLPFAATWVDLEGIVLSEINQMEKDKYRMISLVCGIWKVQQMKKYS